MKREEEEVKGYYLYEIEQDGLGAIIIDLGIIEVEFEVITAVPDPSQCVLTRAGGVPLEAVQHGQGIGDRDGLSAEDVLVIHHHMALGIGIGGIEVHNPLLGEEGISPHCGLIVVEVGDGEWVGVTVGIRLPALAPIIHSHVGEDDVGRVIIGPIRLEFLWVPFSREIKHVHHHHPLCQGGIDIIR